MTLGPGSRRRGPLILPSSTPVTRWPISTISSTCPPSSGSTARGGRATLRAGGGAGAARLHHPSRHHAHARRRSDGPGVPPHAPGLERRRPSLLSVPARHARVMARRRLSHKYFVLFVTLVSGALLASGAQEIYFSYQESKAALVSVQREKAIGAATRIEQFVREIERQMG